MAAAVISCEQPYSSENLISDNRIPGTLQNFIEYKQTQPVPMHQNNGYENLFFIAKSIVWDRLTLDLMRIASFRRNWDDDEAEAISQKAAENTKNLLILAQQWTRYTDAAQGATPVLVPNVDGSITLKWIRGRRELKCTAYDDLIEVSRWSSPEKYESDGYWEISLNRILEGIKEHFDWILQV